MSSTRIGTGRPRVCPREMRLPRPTVPPGPTHDVRLAFGVVVLKQILPFKPGPYAQALDLRLSGLRRHVILGRVEGTGESGQGSRLILGPRHLGFPAYICACADIRAALFSLTFRFRKYACARTGRSDRKGRETGEARDRAEPLASFSARAEAHCFPVCLLLSGVKLLSLCACL